MKQCPHGRIHECPICYDERLPKPPRKKWLGLFLLALSVVPMLLLLVGGASAAVVNETTGITLSSASAQTGQMGTIYYAKSTCTNCAIVGVYKHPNLVDSTAYIYSLTAAGVPNALLASAAITNDKAVFNYPITAGQGYCIMTDNGGASRAHFSNAAGSYPITKQEGIYNKSCYIIGSPGTDNGMYNIISIEVQNATTPAANTTLTDPVNLTITTSNLVNGSTNTGLCANISNTTYSRTACTTTSSLLIQANVTVPNASSLYLPLTSAYANTTHVYDLSPYRNNATINGANVTATETRFDGVNDYLNAGASRVSTGAYSISLWMKPDKLNAYQGVVSAFTSSSDAAEIFVDVSNNRLFCGQYTGMVQSAINSLTAGAWHHVVLSSNGSVTQCFVNAIAGPTNGTDTFTTGTAALEIGRRQTYYFNGSIKDVRVYPRALSRQEVSDLYNGVNFVTGNYNVLAYNISGGTYFNVTQSAYSFTATQTLNLPTYQALLSVSASQLFTGNAIPSFNASTGLASNTTTSGSLTLPANNGTNTVQVNVSGNYSKTLSCTVTSPLSTASCAATGIYDDLYTIGAKTSSGSSVTNFSVNVSNALLGSLYNSSTTNGSIVFPLLQGYDYYYFVDSEGYAYANATLAANTSAQLYNFTLYVSNTINFTFRDEETMALLDYTTVTLNLISELQSYNYTTSNGTLYLELLIPETYTIRYGAAGYAERFYQFTLVDKSFSALSLYLLNSSQGNNVTINVIDFKGEPLEGYTVKVKKYDVTTNDLYINQIIETNFEGQGVISAVSDEYYIFIVEYNNQVLLTTQKSYVYGTSITLQVPATSSGFSQLFENSAISGNVSYDSTTTTAAFRYNDATNTASQACLYAYQHTTAARTLYNSSCSTSTSGVVTVLIDNTTGYSYELQGYVTQGENEYLISSLLVTFKSQLPERTVGFSLLITFVLLVIFVFVARYSLEAAIILSGAIVLVMSVIGLQLISTDASIIVFVLSLIAAYIVGAVR